MYFRGWQGKRLEIVGKEELDVKVTELEIELEIDIETQRILSQK